MQHKRIPTLARGLECPECGLWYPANTADNLDTCNHCGQKLRGSQIKGHRPRGSMSPDLNVLDN